MSSLPQFNMNGLLPPGDYPLTIDQLKESHLVTGISTTLDNWDVAWRRHLVDNAAVLIRQLWQAGVHEIYLDGSFVEDKAHPNDIDGYFVCQFSHFITGALERDLNALEPDKIWTWENTSRIPHKNYAKAQLPMWLKYRVELFPHYGDGPKTGILDEFGHNQLFPAAFRKARNVSRAKGIIRIIPDQEEAHDD